MDTASTITTMDKVGQTRTLTVGLNKLVDNNTEYTLEITYVNPAGEANANAFRISQYDGNPIPSILTDVITGAVKSSGTGNARKLTYTELTLTDAAAMNITFSTAGGANPIVPGQQLEVTATLTEKDGTGTSTNASASLAFEYQKTLYHIRASAPTSPTYLKTGKGVTQFYFYTNLGSTGYNPSNIFNEWANVQKITFADFGPIIINIGGVSKTYNEYVNTYGASSPVLLYPAGVDIDKNPDAYIRPGTAYTYTSANAETSLAQVPFQIKTTDDFKTENGRLPAISFSNFAFNMEATVAGTPVVFTHTTGTEFLKETTPAGFYCSTINVTHTAVDSPLAVEMVSSIYPVNSGVITHNSAQYEADYIAGTAEGHLYYQDMAKLRLNNYTETPVDTEVTLTIPAGVTLTHLRLSSVADSADYGGISFVNDAGQTVEITPSAEKGVPKLVDLAANGVVLQAGESFTFTVNKLKNIMKVGAGNSYSWVNGITLIGVTGAEVASNVTFTATIAPAKDPTATTSNSTTVAVNDNHRMDVYNNMERGATAVAKGELVNITLGTYPVPGPYSTNLRFGLESPKGIVVDPVWYLSLPEGVSIETAKMYMANSTDLYGNPISFKFGETFTGGAFGANGTIYEIYSVQDTSRGGTEGGSVYINSINSSKIVLGLRVAADYEDDAINFKKYSILLGSRWSNSIFSDALTPDKIAADTVNGGFALPDVSELVSNSTNYKPYATTGITVTTPQAIVVTSSAQTKGGYVSYVPGNAEETAPQLFTGETSRSYKTYIFNGLNQNYNNAKAYFVLPSNASWGTGLNGAPTITTTAAAFTVYYTTGDVTSANATLDGSGNLLAGGTEVEWKTLTTGTGAGTHTPTEPTEGWENITAFKYEFATLASGEKLTMIAPFTVPGYDPGKSIVEGSVALGKTLHAFGGTSKEDDPTAAVQLAVASIKGRVYFDANANGGFDLATETGLKDVVVKLYDASTNAQVGDASGYAVVNDDGSYAILDLDDTPLTVKFEIPQSLYNEGYRFKNPAPEAAEDDTLTWSVSVTPGSVASESVIVGLVRRQAVVFNANGGNFSGEETASIIKNIGEKVTAAEAATQQAALTAPTADCTFIGWATKAADGTYTPCNFATGYTIEGETTFYAQWQVGYTVRYVDVSLNPADAGYEVSSAVKTGTVGADVTESFVLPEGYEKAAGQADTESITLASTAQGNVITFECVKKYTLSFNANNGTGSMDSILVAYGTSALLPTNTFTRTGYEFKGWATSASSTTIEHQDGARYIQEGANDVTLYAVWEAIPYTISYNYKNGTAPATDNPTEYTVDILPISITNQPTYYGHTFTGWTGDNGDTPQTTVELTPGTYGNKAYTANWGANSHEVIFDANRATGTTGEGSMANLPVTFGVKKALTPNAYTSNGYSFVGWATSPTAQQPDFEDGADYTLAEDNDITLYAVWSANNYILSFNANGGTGSMADVTVTFGVETTLPANEFEKPGYDFVGWNTDPDATG
ncbi:InlB B-repeat-containing protein, partial [Ruminococcaceae bacterium OttesenSCG-928-A16]|nr:InlB B-repeat-containing protein [Ruminococcaceae bacterium OttesenSCG-928-A16]